MKIGYSSQRREILLLFNPNTPPTWPQWHYMQTSNRQYSMGYTMVGAQFTGNVLPLSCYWKFKPWSIYFKHLNKSTARVDAFAANVSVTTSFPGISHKDAWVNAQLRNPLATINLVIFISRSEFGFELKSWSLSMRSERVTHLHIQNPSQKPFGYPHS